MTPEERQQVIDALEAAKLNTPSWSRHYDPIVDALAIMRRERVPVGWLDADGAFYRDEPPNNWNPPHVPLYKD